MRRRPPLLLLAVLLVGAGIVLGIGGALVALSLWSLVAWWRGD